MKKLVLVLSTVLISTVASAQNHHHVSGYVRSNGTYVAPHEQTNPNNTRNDNYSTYGNVNPYNGSMGTRPRDTVNTYGNAGEYGDND